MSLPSISVVIPSYNRAHLVSRAIDCVLEQTYPQCQVIVADNASADTTAQLIADRYGGNERVRYLLESKRGVSAARNAALAVAQGDYIAFLDSDDHWQPWKLELQVSCMRRMPSVGMLWTDMNAVDDDNNIVVPNCMRASYAGYSLLSFEQIFSHSAPLAELAPGIGTVPAGAQAYWGDVFSAMVVGNLCQPSTVMLTRERAAVTGGFDETMFSGEDHDYHLRASRSGPSGFLDVAATDYRRGSTDQLTAPPYQAMIAANFVTIIERSIREDRGRIKLPRGMLRARRAAAHRWTAYELLWSGERARARSHALRSALSMPMSLRTWMIYAYAAMPEALTSAAHAAYRRAKALMRRRAA